MTLFFPFILEEYSSSALLAGIHPDNTFSSIADTAVSSIFPLFFTIPEIIHILFFKTDIHILHVGISHSCPKCIQNSLFHITIVHCRIGHRMVIVHRKLSAVSRKGHRQSAGRCIFSRQRVAIAFPPSVPDKKHITSASESCAISRDCKTNPAMTTEITGFSAHRQP